MTIKLIFANLGSAEYTTKNQYICQVTRHLQ